MATTRGTSPVPSPCSVPGCDRPVKARGLCNGHYQRWLKEGDVLADVPLGELKTRREPAQCSVPGCDRPVRARGLCNGHYQRLMTHEDVQADRPLGGGAAGPRPECSVSGWHRS